MNVQTTSVPTHQAMQPDTRAHGVAAVPAVQANAPAAATSSVQTVTPAAVQQAVSTLNQAMLQANRALEFSVDTDTSRTVVKMVDTQTGELIRQFPSESALAISRTIDEFQQGALLNSKA